MILEGNINLIHEGRYSKQLAPFDQDTFDGSWLTKSQGKVRDFNVMFKENVAGKVSHFAINEEQSESFTLSGTHDFFFVQNYLYVQYNKNLNLYLNLGLEKKKLSPKDGMG